MSDAARLAAIRRELEQEIAALQGCRMAVPSHRVATRLQAILDWDSAIEYPPPVPARVKVALVAIVLVVAAICAGSLFL